MEEGKTIFELADRGAYGGVGSPAGAGSAVANTDGSVTIPSVCGGCHNTCPMFIDAEGGQVLAAHGEPKSRKTRGALCSKGLATAQIVHDPRRVL